MRRSGCVAVRLCCHHEPSFAGSGVAALLPGPQAATEERLGLINHIGMPLGRYQPQCQVGGAHVQAPVLGSRSPSPVAHQRLRIFRNDEPSPCSSHIESAVSLAVPQRNRGPSAAATASPDEESVRRSPGGQTVVTDASTVRLPSDLHIAYHPNRARFIVVTCAARAISLVGVYSSGPGESTL